jgi:hypothetical protein
MGTSFCFAHFLPFLCFLNMLPQKHDAKRMLLLSRLLHQRRAPQHAYVDPTLENAASGGGRNGGGRNGNGATNGGGRNRKGRGDDDGRRWR